MTGGDDNYWTRSAQRRYGRRTFLRGAALAGTTVLGAWAVACSSSNNHKSGGSAGGASNAGAAAGSPTAAGKAPNQATSLNPLISRTGKNPAGQTPMKGGTFVTAIFANPPTLDPHMTNSANTMSAASAVYSRLYRFKGPWDINEGNNHEIEPDLALSFEAPDAQTWTYKLRPDAAFQNLDPLKGRPVDSDDVKASFTRAVGPTAANRGSLLMIDPAKIETPDKNTVTFKLNFPYAPFSKTMASSIFSWVLPREATDGTFDPAERMVGSGPFTLDSYTPDVALIFKKNPNWFELDIVGPLQEDIPTMTKQNPQAELLQNIGNGNGIMFYPLSAPESIFKDIRVRQAASLAVDRNAYGKQFYGDKYIRTFLVTPDFGKWVIT